MVEFELEIKADDATIRVRASSKEEVLARLADAKSILKKVSGEVPKTRKVVQASIQEEGKRISDTSIPKVPRDLVKFVEFARDGIPKISAKEFFDFSQIEAIALMLYLFDRPLLPKDITRILNSEWKRVSPNSVRDSLADRTKLRPYVHREKEGYRLTGQGRNWVRTRIVPKFTPPKSGALTKKDGS